MNAQPIAVGVSDAARLTGVSQSVIRRAIHSTGRDEFPPPLPARRKGSGPSAPILIRVKDLDDWVARFPAA